MTRSAEDEKRLRVQRIAGCLALPLAALSAVVIFTDSGHDNLGMALLVVAQAVMLLGLGLSFFLYPKRLSDRSRR